MYQYPGQHDGYQASAAGGVPPAPGYPQQQYHHHQQQPSAYGYGSNGASSSSSAALGGPGGPGYPPHHQQYQQQQPPHQYHHQQHSYATTAPPPPHAPSLPYNLATDPDVFRSFYANELLQLTFNSKPIINQLTMLAHEHAQRMAHVVAQCLEDHIRQAPPAIKLPGLYLLDSICKNLGPPYTVLLARTIDRIFLTAYREVDPNTRIKLDELLGTWRNGGQDGGELFKLPPDAPYGTPPPQRIMEEAVFGQQRMGPPYGANGNQSPPFPPPQASGIPPTSASPPHHHQSPHQPQYHHSGPPPPTLPVQQPAGYPQQGQPRISPPPQTPAGPASNMERAAVLYELRKLLSIRREQANVNPADRVNIDQIGTLQQLEQLIINNPLGSTQIAQIRDQLARLTPQRQATPPVQVPKIEGVDEGGRSTKRQRLISPPPPPAQLLSPPQTHATLAGLTSLLNPDLIRSASAQAFRASATPPVPLQAFPPNHPYPQQGAPIPLPPSLLGRHSSSTPQPVPAPIPLVSPVPMTAIPPSLLPRTSIAGGGAAGIPPLGALDSSLLSSLASATAAGGGGAAPSSAASEAIAQARVINERALHAYEQHRMHFSVRLQNSDVARYRPGSHALLYEAMPLRCKQCGNRYLDCPLGKDRLDKDLDRHLRISRRYTEGVGAQRGVGRSWFTLEEEWVLPAHAIKPSEAVIQVEQAKQKAAATAELLNRTVPVPPDAATNEEIRHCPICKEEFKNEFSEEEEDWVWRNAIEVDGRIYHASCKAEQDGHL